MKSFIADSMLGSLARWLRFMGYDVEYFREGEDAELVRIARQGGRTILTRDGGLIRRFRVSAVFIRSESLEEQCREFLQRVNVVPGERRCMRCNRPLSTVKDPESVRDLVPEHVYHQRKSFQICPSCGSIYWKGSHYERMLERVRKVRQEPPEV